MVKYFALILIKVNLMKTTDLDAIQHHSKEYPMEIGAPKFEVTPIQKSKDVALRNAQLAAQKEYDRIMELANVLVKQAQALKRRMELTELVHTAIYSFEPVAGKTYWLIQDNYRNHMTISIQGPNDWSCGHPDYYVYLAHLKCLGDGTWEEAETP